MKIKLTLLLFLLLNVSAIRADEGMWIISLVHKSYEQMKKQGFRLTPEDIYNINKPSIKDAVVDFGDFCTGEIVSDKALLFTNHHCGYDAIQSISSVENNYLKNGFWAQSFDDERNIDDLFVKFLVEIQDVTDKITPKLKLASTEKDRQNLLKTAKKLILRKIKRKYKEKDGYSADVISFFGGNAYYLVIYRKYQDIRLVGTPPESIGNFGGDTDNWMYPRHTGDFSIFRIYADKQNNPAEYSENNIPFKPAKFLEISTNGVYQNDFTMIIGYPGNTQRYITSYGIRNIMNAENPVVVTVRTEREAILKKCMENNEEINIKYSSKIKESANYRKYAQGQNKQIIKQHLLDQRLIIENKFYEWANADKDRQKIYGNVLDTLKFAYNNTMQTNKVLNFYNEAFFNSIEAFQLCFKTWEYYMVMSDKKMKKQLPEKQKELKKYSEKFFKNYDKQTDKAVARAMFVLFAKNIEPKYRPEVYTLIKSQYADNLDEFLNDLFDSSVFTDKKKFQRFLDNPQKKIIENDPVFLSLRLIYSKYFYFYRTIARFENIINENNRLFIKGLEKMYKDSLFYPDANFTMRFTYGKVKGYTPRNAVKYNYFTTLYGLLQKENPDNEEFYVPERLKQLYTEKNYGNYAYPDGKIHVCFITDNDITGGNSGSPVLNADGQLVGLAFDGNWEAMTSDLKYNPELQRTICTDIKYVLFIIDKYAGAERIMNELVIK